MFYRFVIILFLSSLLSAKDVSVSYDPDYAPFSFSIDNKAYGIFIDIWKLWAKKNDHTIHFIKAKGWDDALRLAKEQKVDFFLGTTPHEPWMYGSDTYYKTKTALYSLKNFQNKIQNIGIIGDDYQELLQTKRPEIQITSFPDYKQLLKALISNKVDAIYDDSLAIVYYAIKNGYKHLIKELELFSEISNVQAISANQKNIALFNKGFNKLALEKLESIEAAWISDKNMRYYNNASFLRKKEFSYVYDPDWKPFEYKDEMSHMHMGIIADLLSLVSSKSGLVFHPVATNSWDESIKLLKSHKVDMVSAVPWTKERAKYLNFSKKNIYSYPAVLVSNNTANLAFSDDFSHVRIGVVKGNSLGEWIEKKYPQAQFVHFKNVQEGFQALQDNKIDFFGINGVTANYYINVMGFSDTHIYTILDYMFHLKIAFLKDIDPHVLQLVDEALSKITQKDFSDIYHKWIAVQLKKEVNYKLIFSIIAIALIIISIFILVNKRLNRLVQKRTKELRDLNDNLEQKVQARTKELAQINQKMYENIEYASLIQSAILPNQNELQSFFQECAILWKPKDIVGGDIYFFHKLNEDEALLFVIDCTGHGVSGAFVTMLVKAIEEESLMLFRQKRLTPASALKHFNEAFQKLLIQTDTNINVGFDAGAIYINKKRKTVTFSGANIALYYIYNNEIHRLKPDRHSIGYKKVETTIHYKEEEISLQKDMLFYITTDGYLDQNGGEKGFPFGKKRFEKLLLQYHKESIEKQQEAFYKAFQEYKKDYEQTDDITLIALKVF